LVGCEKEITIIGAGKEATIPDISTHFCILKKGHDGKCMWSENKESNWSYHAKFSMETQKN